MGAQRQQRWCEACQRYVDENNWGRHISGSEHQSNLCQPPADYDPEPDPEDPEEEDLP